jgi:hypothetical protein
MTKTKQDPPVQKRINDLQENLDNIKEAEFSLSNVDLDFIRNELLIPDFMKQNTEFNSFDEMLDQSPFRIRNEILFEVISETDRWDHFVAMNTRFYGWIEMIKSAVLDRALRKMEMY